MLQWGFDSSGFSKWDEFAKAVNINQAGLTIKIGDFGFARYLSQHEELTSSTGTPAYMAPEVIKGQSYDFKADIWSLGATFYEILTGYNPFIGHDKKELFLRIKNGKYQVDKNLGLSPYCIDFLKQCLQFDPRDRASASQLLNHPFLAVEFRL